MCLTFFLEVTLKSVHNVIPGYRKRWLQIVCLTFFGECNHWLESVQNVFTESGKLPILFLTFVLGVASVKLVQDLEYLEPAVGLVLLFVGMKVSLAACCSVSQCFAACCSVLQRVAACWSMKVSLAAYYSVLQCFAACCSVLWRWVLQRITACCRFCSVLQRVAACCSALQRVAVWRWVLQRVVACRNVWQHVAACCSVLQHDGESCSVLQRVAACRSILQRVALWRWVSQRVAAYCSVLQRVAACCSFKSVPRRIQTCPMTHSTPSQVSGHQSAHKFMPQIDQKKNMEILGVRVHKN